MKNVCQHCKNEFSAERTTAKFCSDRCRKLAFQNREVSVPMDAKISVPVSVLSVPKVTVPEVSVPKVTVNSSPEDKAKGKWGEVCSLEEWKKYPAMCENKAQQKALCELYSSFTAKELFDNGFLPPAWKKDYATYQEAMSGLNKTMEELGLVKTKFRGVDMFLTEKQIDYSKWK